MDIRPLKYIVVGSGWRSLFYWRISQAYPDLLRLEAMLCRTEEKAAVMREKYGIPAVTKIEACEASHPDFVVIAVNKDAIASAAMEWIKRGYPVFLETPAAMDVQTLKKLWALKQSGAKIQVAEQYFLYPTHAAAISTVRQGYLGDSYAIDISTVHDYHAASLIRRYLGLGMESVTISGSEYFFPIEETDSRYGYIADGTVKNRRRVRLTFCFDCGRDDAGENSKKYAFYDFDGVQYHSRIRSRYLRVMGQTGELYDNQLKYVDKEHQVHCGMLVSECEKDSDKIRRIMLIDDNEDYEQKQTKQLIYENPFLRLKQEKVLSEDETAIGTLLLGMRQVIEENIEVYPLKDALQDAYLRILMEQAISDGKPAVSEQMPWME